MGGLENLLSWIPNKHGRKVKRLFKQKWNLEKEQNEITKKPFTKRRAARYKHILHRLSELDKEIELTLKLQTS